MGAALSAARRSRPKISACTISSWPASASAAGTATRGATNPSPTALKSKPRWLLIHVPMFATAFLFGIGLGVLAIWIGSAMIALSVMGATYIPGDEQHRDY